MDFLQQKNMQDSPIRTFGIDQHKLKDLREKMKGFTNTKLAFQQQTNGEFSKENGGLRSEATHFFSGTSRGTK